MFSNQLKLFTFDLDNESFYHIQHPQKLLLSSWMRPLSVLYILQTNKLSKMYEIDQIYGRGEREFSLPFIIRGNPGIEILG